MEAFFIATMIAVLMTAAFIAFSSYSDTEYTRWRLGKVGEFIIRGKFSQVLFHVAAAVLIVFGLFIVLLKLHPSRTYFYSWAEFFRGRAFLGICFGLLFGILLVLWLRVILVKKAEEITWREAVIAVFMVVLLIVGGMSDQLASWLNRLTEFSAPGIKFAFDPIKSPDQSRRGSPGLGGTSYDDRSKSFNAIDQIASLGSNVKNDPTYVGMFPPRDKSASSRFYQVKDVTSALNDMIGYFATCLGTLSSVGQDEEYVRDRIREIADPFRAMSVTPSGIHALRGAAAERLELAESKVVGYCRRRICLIPSINRIHNY